jgi:hypothetical protein
MTDDPPPTPSLRERLQARGAKPHSRMSDLSRYMLVHHDELQALITVDGYSWADIAAVLSEEEGLTDETGKPITAVTARLAWSRLRRRATKPAPQPPARPDGPPDPRIVHTHLSEGDPGLPFAAQPDAPTIRPARPRGAMTAPFVPTASAPASSEQRAASEAVDDLTRRLSARKMPPPDLL